MPRQRKQFAKLPIATPGPLGAHDERLRAFASIGADWFWEMDAALRISFLSDRLDAGTAPYAADFIGKRIEEIDGPGFSEIDWRPLRRRLDMRAPFRDFRFIGRDQRGNIRHLAISGSPVFDEAGRFQGYHGIGRDITKESLAEERAAVAQTLLIDAIESIPESFMLLDAKDRLVLCNSRYRELHAPIAHLLVPGTSFEEICRASAEAELPAPAIGRAEEWVRDRLARHRQPHFEVEERQIGDGWFRISEQRTRSGSCVVVQSEITAVKRREQELAEKTALLRATLDNMDQGLLVIDASLGVKIWNDRVLDLLDIPAHLMQVGVAVERIIEFCAGCGDGGLGDLLKRVTRPAEWHASTPRIEELTDAKGRIIEMRHTPMPDGGVLFTCADVTNRKRVEDDLRRAKEEAELASRSKTEFLANMSHELRTPLNAIIGFSDILKGQIFGSLGDSRYADYARDIHDSGHHLLNLINDVLDVSKVEFGKVELVEETVDITDIIEACQRLMRERASAAGLRLSHELPSSLPLVQGDSRRLKQIVLNLLSNAVKFTPAGGRVTIRVQDGAEGLRVMVEDTGIGIAASDLDKALRPFGQIDSRLARKYQGTGLGLPLARSMAELHGGRLELHSTPGKGTTATLWLPATRVFRGAGVGAA